MNCKVCNGKGRIYIDSEDREGDECHGCLGVGEPPTHITQEDIQARTEELIAVCLDTVVSLELLNHIIELATAARDVRIAEIERYTRGF